MFLESSIQPEFRRCQIVTTDRAWRNISSDALYRCTGVIMVNKQRLSLSKDAIDSFFQALLGLRVIIVIDFLTFDQVIPVNDAALVPQKMRACILRRKFESWLSSLWERYGDDTEVTFRWDITVVLYRIMNINYIASNTTCNVCIATKFLHSLS
jgi:hypothetical protein